MPVWMPVLEEVRGELAPAYPEPECRVIPWPVPPHLQGMMVQEPVDLVQSL